MLKEKLNKLKVIVEGKGEGNKQKKIENLVVFLIILIITVIAINVIWKDKESVIKEENTFGKQLALMEDIKLDNVVSEEQIVRN